MEEETYGKIFLVFFILSFIVFEIVTFGTGKTFDPSEQIPVRMDITNFGHFIMANIMNIILALCSSVTMMCIIFLLFEGIPELIKFLYEHRKIVMIVLGIILFKFLLYLLFLYVRSR